MKITDYLAPSLNMQMWSYDKKLEQTIIDQARCLKVVI